MSAQLACFGFITCFDGNSETCLGCDNAKLCQKSCYDALTAMDGAGEIQRLLRKHERWAKRLGNPVISASAPLRENFETPKEDDRVKGLSRVAKDIARALLHNFINLSNVSIDQIISLKPRYLTVMLELYISKVIVTAELISLLKATLGWRHSTAKSYAAGFIEVLNHWKLVSRYKRGCYKVIA